MTTSDCTPNFLCLQAGRKIILRLEDHVFERMTQVASTGGKTESGSCSGVSNRTLNNGLVAQKGNSGLGTRLTVRFRVATWVAIML